MLKFKKIISIVTLFSFCLFSYSPVAAFASEGCIQEGYAVQQEDYTEIFVKDTEVKEWLEKSDNGNYTVTVVEEFPEEIEAAMATELEVLTENSLGEQRETLENRAVAIPLGVPLATWLSDLLYAALLAAMLIITVNGIELAPATDIANDVADKDHKYYQTYFGNKTIYVGGALTLVEATQVLDRSTELGYYGTGPHSWKQWGNVMCKNAACAVTLAEKFKSVTGGVATPIQDPHGDCGYYGHIHVGKAGVDLTQPYTHSAHIWFY